MFALENLPACYLQVGRLFVEKGEPAELGRRFASQNVDPASGILGSFIMEKSLNITLFLLTNVLNFQMC